jgi:hypothetical protein
MACVITVDGKSYDETGFKQMLGSGFLVNEINSGVLKDSKSEIYKQYVNGDSTKETARGEGEQALQEGVTPEGEGTEIDQAATGTQATNQIPGFEQLTDNQKAEFDAALASINEGLETPISAREAFNKLVTYLQPENIPFITNMKSALLTSLDESYAKNILRGLERDGKTQIKGKFARTPLGRTLLGLSASMKSLGISMVVLSDEDFNNFIENAYGLYDKDRNAIYSWGAKTMVLKASNTSQVALHEFTHPILEIIEQVDPELYNSLTTELDTLIHPERKMTYLEWAEINYPGANKKTIINEALTELISNEADRRINLNSPAKIAANRIWQSIMAFFGIKGASINIKIDDTLTVDKLSKAISLAVVSSRALKVQELAGVEQTTAEGIASSKGANLVSEAGLDKYMTEDGKGNYVFYHVSGLDLTRKGIDPNKLGSNARTGRDEVMAKHPVSMYYTEPDIEDVGGSYKHVVLIPKNKVYPIDSDPLNLKPLAEKEFRKVFPNISFDNNRASSWIAKVAAEKGYDIVVANWSPRKNFKALRAESAIKHKPDLYQKPKPGSLNAVTFNEKYEFESNRNSVKKSIENLDSPGLVTGGKMNKRGISSSKATNTPVSSVYDSKEVTKLPVVSLEDMYDKYDGRAVVINSDPTRVGDLVLPSGEKIFMYGGPGYLSIKDNVDGDVGFATTQVSKVESWQKYTNNLFGNNKSLTFVATQSPESMMSNSYALRYVMNAISTLPKSVLKSSEFKAEFFGKNISLLANAFGEKSYMEFVSKYKKSELSNPEVINQMISEMAYKIGNDNNPASFRARRAFVSNLIAELGVKKPVKFIAKELLKRHDLNTEKLLYELGVKELVDLYINDNKWGFLVSGFETDPSISIESVQKNGVIHPLFNAKFPSSNAFFLDGAYEVDKLFKPISLYSEEYKTGVYVNKASQMLSGSMYVKGEKTQGEGSFEYSKESPTPNTRGISSSRSTVKFNEKKFNADPVIEEMKSTPVESGGGATINLDGSKYEGGGLVIPIGSINFKASDLTKENVLKFIKDNLGKISGDAYKFGFYKFEGEDKISVDINVVVDPKYRELGLKFGKMAGQKSLFNLDTMKEDETGADGSNTMSFTDEQARAIGEAFSRGEFPSSVFEEKGTTDVTSKFAESAKLFDQIQEADGSAKKRRLAEERRALIESSPEVKFIDDNIKKIYEQLENKGILTREGNCP